MTQSTNIIYDTVDIIIRPVRVLWCIPVGNLQSGFQAIKYNSRFWGGKYNALVPFNQGKIAERWIRFVEKFDPDMVVVLSDEKFDQKQFNKLLCYGSFRKSSSNQKGVLTSTHSLGMNIHKVSDILSKYRFNYKPVFEVTTFKSFKIALLGNPPEKYKDITTTLDPEWETITLCQFFGSLSGLLTSVDDNLYYRLSEILEISSVSMEEFNADRHLPFSIDMFSKYTTEKTFIEGEWPLGFATLLFSDLIIIVGDTQKVESLALFWNLRIHYNNDILWVNPDHLDELLHDISNSDKHLRIAVVSHELHKTVLARRINELSKKLNHTSIEAVQIEDLSLLPRIAITPKKYPIKPVPVTIINNKALFTVYHVDKFINSLNMRKGRMNFIVELQFKNMKIPEKKALCSLYSPHRNVRITKSGNLCFFLSDEYFEIDPQPIVSYHFEILKPNVMSILKNLCKTSLGINFIQVDLSDKGKYSRKMIKLFGSLDKCARSFKENYYHWIIDSFLYGGNKLLTRNEREWTYSGLEQEVKRRKKTTNELDQNEYMQCLEELVKAKIILQGLNLKCKECGNKDGSWYPLRQLTETFQCSRCLTEGLIPLKPKWCYRLNNIAFVAYTQFFQPTVKALVGLEKRKKVDFDYLPEFEIEYMENNEKKKIELDFFVISDGKIGIGEAKNSIGGFGKSDYEKMIKMLDMFNHDFIFLSFYNLKNKDPYSNTWIQKLDYVVSKHEVKLQIV